MAVRPSSRRSSARAAVLATLTSTVLAAASALATTAPAGAAVPGSLTTTATASWGLDGRVLAFAAAGDRVVAVGEFGQAVGPEGQRQRTGQVALHDPVTGRFSPWSVETDGVVNAVAVDGDTAYLGGTFRTVDGQKRPRLAAISLTDGSLLPFNPKADRPVTALAVVGGRLYVGGLFTTLTDGTGAVATPYLARLDLGPSPTVDRVWSTSVTPNERVLTILAKPGGGQVYVGGEFSALNGQAALGRLSLLGTGGTAVVDPSFRSGATNEGNRAPVLGLDLSGNALLVAAGGGGGGCTVLDATTGQTVWSIHANGNVVAAAIVGDRGYCGGHFSGPNSFGPLKRMKLAEITLATGVVTSWAPVVDSALGLWSLAATPAGLYLGGDFTRVDAVVQPRLALVRQVDRVTAPGAPVDTTVVGGDGVALLTWGRPDTDGGARVRTYVVERRVAGAVSWSRLTTTADTSYLDGTATNGTTWEYRVSARTPVATGVAGSTASATPTSGVTIAPSAPTAFSAVGEPGRASLAWSAPVYDGGSPVTGYQVQRGTDVASLAPLATVDGATRSWVDASATVGTRYTYRVVAVNAVGAGTPSATATATPNTGKPSAPVLAGSVVTSGISLVWDPPDDPGGGPLTQYILIRDGVRVHVNDGTGTAFTDTGVVPGRSYVYKVKAVNAFGASKWSNQVTLTR